VTDFELPGWTIKLSEQSPGVWRLEARHEAGPTFETSDGDTARAFDRLADYDAKLFSSGTRDSPAP
jgi:hypothetical protein